MSSSSSLVGALFLAFVFGCAMAENVQNCTGTATCSYACPINSTNGICHQKCQTSECHMVCDSKDYECLQECPQGCGDLGCTGMMCNQNCVDNCTAMACNSTTMCRQECGSCSTMFCTSNSCYMQASGNNVSRIHCDSMKRCEFVCIGNCTFTAAKKEAKTTATCSGGHCTLKCPKDAPDCECTDPATCKVEYYSSTPGSGAGLNVALLLLGITLVSAIYGNMA